MRKNQLFVYLMLMLLSFSQVARGKPLPITITGPATACLGDVKSYSVSPGVPGHYYFWSVSAAGLLITGNPSNPATIQWVATGPAVVTVQEKDGAGVVINTGNLSVTVYAVPAPYITTDSRVACQTFDTSGADTTNPRDDKSHNYVLDDENGCPKVCEFSYVNYYAHSTTGGTGTWLWTVSGGIITGGTPTSPTITVHWGPAGPGHITLAETNGGTCTGISSICIDIINRPKASFVIEPFTTPLPFYTACIYSSLVFHDLSTAGTGSGITTWHWDFGDGAIASIPNPTHVYTAAGTYTVTLVVTNACGCTDTATTEVKVDPQTGPDIQCPGAVCERGTATYSTSASGCASYNWTVTGGVITSGLGTSSITVQWGSGDASGYGYVSLDVSGCGAICPGTTTIKVPIIQSNPFVTRTADPVCTNKPYQFGIPVWPSTQYHWGVVGHPGWVVSGVDNNIATIQFPLPGTYKVHVWYENSLTFCGGDLKFDVTVMDPPTITGVLNLCASATTSISYTTTTGVTGNWTLNGPGGYVLTGSGVTFNGVFPVAGKYSLSVTGATFCPPDPITINVIDVPTVPSTLTGPSLVCFGSPYTYQVTAPVAGTVFNWSVSPAGAATLSSTSGTEVTVIWNTAGTICVNRVSVMAPHCPGPSLCQAVAPFPMNPYITGPTSVCAGATYSFSDNYYLGDNTTWKIITNDLGSVTSGELTPDITTLWHDVAVPTVATVQATVKQCGITTVVQATVNVLPAPVVTVSGMPAGPICSGTTVTLTATGGALIYTWDFGDGTPTGYGNPIVHTFNTPHTSTSPMSFTGSVTVSGVSGPGCPPTGAATFTVNVIPGPYASITSTGPFIWCAGTPVPTVTLVSVVTNNIGTVTYWWYGPSGFITSGTTITTLPVSGAGDYHLEITDGSPCSYISNTIHLEEVPCTVGTGCSGPAIGISTTVGSCGHVNAHVTAVGATSVTWAATAGHSGITATGSAPDFYADLDYTVPGYYTIFAEAVFPSGCTTTVSYTVTVPVIAHYYYDWDCSTSPYYTLKLHDISDVLAPYVGGLTCDWTVSGGGGGFFPATNNLTLSSLTPGVHTITLTSTAGGVSCSITGTVDVPGVTSVSFTAIPPTSCEGAHIDFPMSVSGGALSTWTWDYGDPSGGNSNVPGERNYTYSITSPASHVFTVTLTGSNVIGCAVSYSTTVTIWNNNLRGNVTPPNYVACSGTVPLSYAPFALTTPPSAWAWSNGPTTSIDVVGVTGNYLVTVFDAHGCQFVTDRNHVAIINSTPPTIYGNTMYCAGDNVVLGGYMGTGYTYQWYRNSVPIGGATSENLVDAGLPVGTYTYQVQVTGPVFMGTVCPVMSAPFPVTIYALPPAPVISGPVALSCPLYQLQLTATGVPGTFNWSSGLPGVGPVDVVDHGGAVRCWLTDIHGCMSHADVLVPNSPESYKDWFPEGCYTYCRDLLSMGAIKVYGPPGVFNLWDWMMGYSSLLSGTSSTIAPLTLTGPGNYELTLGNGLCTATFAEMQVSDAACQCDAIIRNATAVCDPDPNNPHGYLVTITFNNPYGPIAINLGMDIGPLVPFTWSLPPGASTVTFSFTTLAIPPPATATIWTLYHVPWGQCYDHFTVGLPPCVWTPEKPGADAQHGTDVRGGTGMLVYPNPAAESVSVNYVYGNESDADRRVALYDAVGRKVAEREVSGIKGTVSLSLAGLAAGSYVVRMEENGKTVHVQHLSVTH